MIDQEEIPPIVTAWQLLDALSDAIAALGRVRDASNAINCADVADLAGSFAGVLQSGRQALMRDLADAEKGAAS